MKLKLTIALIALSSGFIKAQDAKSASGDADGNNRIFGLGIKTFNLTNDIIESPIVTPGNKAVLTLNPHNNFRVQAELGYLRVKVTSANYKDGVIDKTFLAGFGLYGMKQKEKTNLYGGLKYVYCTNEDQSLFSSSTGTSVTYTIFTQNVTTHAYGVAAGGEYLLGKHFSLGAEIAFLRAVTKSGSSYPGSMAEELQFMFTETNLLARFYF